MEPPTNVSGCSASHSLTPPDRGASMEPPTNVSGCADGYFSRRDVISRFNGAAHERERMRACNTLCLSHVACFNGAAHERERMPVSLSLSRTRRCAASMEPPTNVSGCRK